MLKPTTTRTAAWQSAASWKIRIQQINNIKHIKMKKDTYIAPKVEVYEIEAEQGFSATSTTLSSSLNDWSDGEDYNEVSF